VPIEREQRAQRGGERQRQQAQVEDAQRAVAVAEDAPDERVEELRPRRVVVPEVAVGDEPEPLDQEALVQVQRQVVRVAPVEREVGEREQQRAPGRERGGDEGTSQSAQLIRGCWAGGPCLE
jgi:hypothetical protein